jgi:hypothetical protein
MSTGDDVADRILTGDAYDRAEVTVRRTFPLPIESKIRAAVGILAVSGLLAPALVLSRGRIQSFEGSETLSLTIAVLALVGVVTAFGGGLLLVAQLAAVHRRSLSDAEARRLVRTEDVLMWFIVQGAAFVLIPVVLAVIGVVSAGAIETLYGYSVRVYRPSGLPGVDARLVSVLGWGSAVLLYGLYRGLRA